MATALKEMDDITECSICTKVFTDPRVLPCVHTFCLKCIEGWSKGKRSGDKITCPLCRKQCAIPEEGLAGLPRNFFVDKMLHIRELARAEVQSTVCDMCKYRAESGATKINSATSYCLRCQENLCQSCATAHRKQKMSRDHKLVRIGEEVKLEDLCAQYPAANCERHTDETLKIYCDDCGDVICMMCYIKDHNAHKCSDVNEVVDEFRARLTTDGDNVTTGLERCKRILLHLDSEKERFGEQIRNTELEIRRKANQLKDMIEEHKQTLISELASLKEKRTKEMKAAYEEVQRHMTAIESFKTYAQEIREKGTPCDIARAANGLHERADELLSWNVVQRITDQFGHVEVAFKSPQVDKTGFRKCLGVLQTNISTPGDTAAIETSTTRTPVLQQSIRGETAVYGVTSVGNRVYVIRNLETEVEVYDAKTMTLQKRLLVPELSDVSSLVGCAHYNCLYAGDWKFRTVHRVDLTKPKASKSWAVAKIPEGLSVNRAHNLLVSCLTRNKIQEYTTIGDLVREIRLPDGVTDPWHAIQLSTGDYVVSQYSSPGMISIISADGQVRRSFGRTQTAMEYPVSLAINKAGDILVADRGNSRILAINSTLTSAQEFPIPAETALRKPYALWLDEAHDRLYVGEMRGSYPRLLVFSNVNSVRWK